MSKQMWQQCEALDLVRRIEAICPKYGCHVALTGGLLYKDGPRKDADILFYRIRQEPKIDVDGLFGALSGALDIVRGEGFGWLVKATLGGKNIDFFFPEEQDGMEYRPSGDDDFAFPEEAVR